MWAFELISLHWKFTRIYRLRRAMPTPGARMDASARAACFFYEAAPLRRERQDILRAKRKSFDFVDLGPRALPEDDVLVFPERQFQKPFHF